ncbi:hypothetical protein ACHRVK_03645 [Flavobacterium plurextorum]|uniref:hypothetical protein n=1 Tax=Flavobacterium plurextorum TaxID=1114867 RepID=UPI003756F623
MKKSFILILSFLCYGITSAQEKISKEEKTRRQQNINAANPFTKFGSKAKVATLSNGKYLEVHDLDSIVVIGTVRFNVERNEIVGAVTRTGGDEDSQPVGDVTSRWMSPDPLSEEYRRWSPYTYGVDNPVRFTDPDGMSVDDVVITGNKKEETLAQLNKGSELTLTMDDKGKVSAAQNFIGPLTAADTELKNATTDSSFTASINSTDGFQSTDGTGAYLTSLGGFDGSVKNADGTMTANQTVNPDFGAKVDNHVGRPEGVGVVHETLEAIQEAKRAVATGKPANYVTDPKSAQANYGPAHAKARALDPRHTDNYDNPVIKGVRTIINSNGQRMPLYIEPKK